MLHFQLPAPHSVYTNLIICIPVHQGMQGAKSTFGTSEKNALLSLCEFVTASMEEKQIELAMSSFCSLYSDQKMRSKGSFSR